jgi:hypothetical protein
MKSKPNVATEAKTYKPGPQDKATALMTAPPSPSSASLPPARHPRFYFSDGNVTLLVHPQMYAIDVFCSSISLGWQ